MLASFLVFAVAAGGQFADLVDIDRQVARFTGASVGEDGGATTPVDRRLRLQSCRSSLALSWRTTAKQSVVVQCQDPSGWRLFVSIKNGLPAQAGPQAVIRGDAVSIMVAGDGFTVSQPGEAMDSGPVGGWIRVRPIAVAGTGINARSQIMRARIEQPGVVYIPLPN